MTRLRRTLWAWILCALLLPGLTGCWDSAGLDNIAFIHEVIVRMDRGRCDVYISLLNVPVVTETGDKSPPAQESPEVLARAQGRNFIEAVNHLYATSPKRLLWSQFNVLILHESALRGNVTELMDVLLRYREIRPTIWVYATRVPPMQLLQSQPPVERNPLYSNVDNPSGVQQYGTVLPSQRLHAFLRELYEPGVSPLLPELTLNAEPHVKWRQGKKRPDAIRLSSAAMFSNRRFIGWLPKKALRGVMWARTGGTRVPLQIRSPFHAAVYLHHNKVKVISRLRRGRVYYTLQVRGKADLAEQTQPIDLSVLRKTIQKEVRDDIMDAFQEGRALHSDVLGLGRRAYEGYLVLWPFRSHSEARESIRLRADSLESVDVQIRISHSGMRYPMRFRTSPDPSQAALSESGPRQGNLPGK